MGGPEDSISRGYNNTFCNCAIGISFIGTSSCVAKNNLLTNSDAPCSETFGAGTDYNVTEDSSLGYTVTGGGNSHDHVSHTFTFIDSGAKNFHLSSSDVGAIGFGVSDPGSGLFSNDIDGTSRTGSWDCGADQHAVISPWYYYSQI